VKICPQNAIEVRHYADVVPMGASVQPLRGTDSIMWTIKFRNGILKRFKFPIRTTPEGSADPYGPHGDAVLDEITDHSTLFTKATHSGDTSQFIAS
jgi:adenylylsulfate reductase, subunit B